MKTPLFMSQKEKNIFLPDWSFTPSDVPLERKEELMDLKSKKPYNQSFITKRKKCSNDMIHMCMTVQ